MKQSAHDGAREFGDSGRSNGNGTGARGGRYDCRLSVLPGAATGEGMGPVGGGQEPEESILRERDLFSGELCWEFGKYC